MRILQGILGVFFALYIATRVLYFGQIPFSVAHFESSILLSTAPGMGSNLAAMLMTFVVSA